MTKRMELLAPESPEPEPEPQPATFHTPMVVWVHEGPVCVTIIDAPPSRPHRGVCTCDACAHSRLDDLPAPFDR
jgi:hypothetical protein